MNDISFQLPMTCPCEENYGWEGTVNDELSNCFKLPSTTNKLKSLVVDTTARRLIVEGDTFMLPDEAIYDIISSTTCEDKVAMWEQALQRARSNQLVACKRLNP